MKIVYFGCDLFFDCFSYFVNNPDTEVMALFTFNSDDEIDSNKKVVALANEKGISVYFNKPEIKQIESYFSLGADFLFSAGYLYKIPVSENIRGVNLHPALLPIGRGPWPYPYFILKGFSKTGITFHKIESSFDSGDILLQKEYPIGNEDTLDTLIKKSADEGVRLLPKLINSFWELWNGAKKQGEGEYWDDATKEYSVLTNDLTVEEVKKRIRAFGSCGVTYNGKRYYSYFGKTPFECCDGTVFLK